MAQVKTSLANKLTGIAVTQLEKGSNFRKDRLETITRIEDFYLNKTKKALKARFSVCLPIMGAFIDNLLGEIDNPPVIKFGHKEEADRNKSKKLTSAWESDSQDPLNDWLIEDLDSKKFAAMSGVGVLKFWAESDPKYKANLAAVDYNDFVCEPKGGADLEKHFYLGQENIFKSWTELKKGAKGDDPVYNLAQVNLLRRSTNDKDAKRNETIYQERKNRYQALGLNPDEDEFVGESLYRLTEWGMVYGGKRYYILFDYTTGIWVRCELLKDVFKSNLWPWVAWHTHRDKRVFWTKGPADDMLPVCEISNILFNQALENRQNANFGQRAYDSKVFPDPSQLEWRPGGLIRAKTQGNKSISSGIYEFKTDEMAINGTIDMISFMDSYWGQKTGSTPSTQGKAERDKKVGIFFGELQQIAKRLGPISRYFRRCWAQLGLRWMHGLREHMPERLMVKVIGERGEGWEEMVKEDLEFQQDPDIIISGGEDENDLDVLKKERQLGALDKISNNQLLTMAVNPKWLVEKILKTGDYGEAEIKRGMDIENFGYEEVITEAAEENQKMQAGESVRPNRKAVIAHIKRHMDMADTIDNEIESMKEEEGSEDKIAEKEKAFQVLNQHIQEEMPYVVNNMKRDAMMKKIIASQTQERPAGPAQQETPAAVNDEPAPVL